jgi:hypothetical protein
LTTWPDFREVKPGHFKRHRAAQQGFFFVHGRRGGAAQQEVLPVLVNVGWPVYQHPQHVKQLRLVLHFVNDHKPLQVRKRFPWLGQPAQRDGVFQIKIVGRVSTDELPGEGGFTHLARPDQLHSPECFQESCKT